jgi:hypothetical protein
MDQLASGTGGFAIFGTNEFARNMARVMDDVRTHYEISYVPLSTVYDGRFRKIEVKVKDPDLVVQTRQGYFALPDLNGRPTEVYETGALQALSQTALPNALDFRVATLRFQPTAQGFRYEMVFDLATSSLQGSNNEQTKKARLHAVFLALIKDQTGQVVDKISQDLWREVPLDKLEQFRSGRMITTLPFEASVGRYTIEAVVNEPETGHSAARKLSLVVAKPALPSLSAITLVRELIPLTEARNPGNPLEFANGRVIPAIREGVRSGADTGLFFVVYPGEEKSAPKVRVQFYKEGLLVAQTDPEPGPPDEVHSIPMGATAKLPAGQYEVTVTVEQSGLATKQATVISVDQ